MIDPNLCECIACAEVRQDGLIHGDGMCFSYGPVHGPLCIDPWKTGCVCPGTAVDGECEACWLWMK